MAPHLFIVFKGVGHGIEILGQLAKLVPGCGFDPRRKVAVGQLPGPPGQPLDRSQEMAREHKGNEGGQSDHDTAQKGELPGLTVKQSSRRTGLERLPLVQSQPPDNAAVYFYGDQLLLVVRPRNADNRLLSGIHEQNSRRHAWGNFFRRRCDMLRRRTQPAAGNLLHRRRRGVSPKIVHHAHQLPPAAEIVSDALPPAVGAVLLLQLRHQALKFFKLHLMNIVFEIKGKKIA